MIKMQRTMTGFFSSFLFCDFSAANANKRMF